MDQSTSTAEQLPEFSPAQPGGAWYDRPADTAVLEPDVEVGPADTTPEPESDWERRFDAGLDPAVGDQGPPGAQEGATGDPGATAPGEQELASLESRLRPPALPEGLGINPAVLEDILLRQIVVDVRNTTTAVAATTGIARPTPLSSAISRVWAEWSTMPTTMNRHALKMACPTSRAVPASKSFASPVPKVATSIPSWLTVP